MGNEKRLLWAGFTAILAAGVGFAIRGGIFDNWQTEFGFSGADMGAIGGAGFTGFCFGIVIGGMLADKLGYGKLVVAAFALHILSAVVTFMAAPGNKAAAYQSLLWGLFIFAFANGTLEAVANPLVATLFPKNRTHYLNILHASWPLGMIAGGMVGWVLDDAMKVDWRWQLSLYLIPTVAYGIMFLGQPMPKSEASAKGLSMGEMFKDVGILGSAVVCFLLALFFNGALGFDQTSSYMIALALVVCVGFLTREQTQVRVESLGALVATTLIGIYFQQSLKLPLLGTAVVGGLLLAGLGKIMSWSVGSFLLFALFIAHALVGAVELGTDGWIQNITGNILSSTEGKILFVFTSLVMFGLRFCAHFIEKNVGLSPVGILLSCSVLAVIGLNLTSMANSFIMAMLALTVYGVGKTFFWPTMLAVASDRFPKTGAVAISFMGGIGMMSAGLIGSAGLGYSKDRFAAASLEKTDAPLYEKVKAEKTSAFLFFSEVKPIDGKVLGDIKAKKAKLEERRAKKETIKPEEELTAQDKALLAADIKGDRLTLVADSAIPALMALIYLGILLYFKGIGGYKPVSIDEGAASKQT
jgi:MFS family permease